jgi:type II secretory pathway pseudopilin PulG
MSRFGLKTRGFALIELAIVLGVIALVLGGVWVLASKLREMARVNATKEQMIVMLKNIRGYYESRGCMPNGDQTATLSAANLTIFPQEMIVGAGVVRDQWGGPVTVVGNNAPCSFTIRFGILPGSSCIELVPMLTAPGEASRGLLGASINTVALNALPANPSAIAGTAAGQCNQALNAQIDLNYAVRVTD